MATGHRRLQDPALGGHASPDPESVGFGSEHRLVEVSTSRSNQLSSENPIGSSGWLINWPSRDRDILSARGGFDRPEYRLRVGPWQVRFCWEAAGIEGEGLSVSRVLHRREVYRQPSLARQGILEAEGCDEAMDWEMQERMSDWPRA